MYISCLFWSTSVVSFKRLRENPQELLAVWEQFATFQDREEIDALLEKQKKERVRLVAIGWLKGVLADTSE